MMKKSPYRDCDKGFFDFWYLINKLKKCYAIMIFCLRQCEQG